MKDENKLEFDRRVRLGLIPARNPLIGQVTVYSNQQHELLKADHAKIHRLIAARERSRHLQNSLSRQDEINRFKLKERRTAQIKQFFEKQKTAREDSAV